METTISIVRNPTIGFNIEASVKIKVPPARKLVRKAGSLKAVLIPGTDMAGMSYPDIQRIGKDIGEGGFPMSQAYLSAQENGMWDHPRPNWLALLYVEVDEKYWLEQASYPLVHEVLSVAAIDPATVITAHIDGAYHPSYWNNYGFRPAGKNSNVLLHCGGLQWPTGSWAHAKAEEQVDSIYS